MRVIVRTCPARKKALAETLARLAKTDLGNAQLVIVSDDEDDPSLAGATRCWEKSVAEILAEDGSPSDVFLILEDAAEYNPAIGKALASWEPLNAAADDPFFGTLYSPRVGAGEAARAEKRTLMLDPTTWWGAQAVVANRAMLTVFSESWGKKTYQRWPTFERRIGMILADLRQKVACHVPSLVQRTEDPSTTGTKPHRAATFNANWRP